MLKNISVGVLTSVMALSMTVLPALASGDGDVVINSNSAFVVNGVSVGANTGDNGASGAVGGDGGNGGNINNNDGDDVDDSTTGNGGAGGDATGEDSGGYVGTGNATAGAGVTNVVNTNNTTINRCGCDNEDDEDGGHTFVMNRNRAMVLNGVGVGANSGENGASGAEGGEGGNGGNINNNGGEDVDDSDTGNGGAGGDGGEGGTVLTGSATAGASVMNVVNRNVTRIRR